MINKQDFFEIITEAGNAHDFEVNKGQIEVYYDEFKQYDAEALHKAFKQHRRTVEFFPRISQITTILEGSTKEISADAWAKVMLEIRKTGSYGEPRVSPEIKQAIDKIGGWKVICGMTHKELEFKARDFNDIYRAPATGLALEYNPSTRMLEQ
jgi:hypothetical protein